MVFWRPQAPAVRAVPKELTTGKSWRGEKGEYEQVVEMQAG